jgi:hypothetical protein
MISLHGKKFKTVHVSLLESINILKFRADSYAFLEKNEEKFSMIDSCVYSIFKLCVPTLICLDFGQWPHKHTNSVCFLLQYLLQSCSRVWGGDSGGVWPRCGKIK